MRLRNLWFVGLLIVAGAWSALGNTPPAMDDQYVTTVQNTPVTFEIVAADEDIDPLNPDAHPLRFVLLDGPSHGLLIGDMEKVLYEGPHNAVVELAYVPATGFVGTDRVTIAVYDPFDETASGTITLQIDVAARRAEGLLSGNWSTNMTWESQSGSFTAFATQLTEVYRIGALTLKGTAQWRMASVGGVKKVVFDALRFNGDIKLGDLSLSSTLAFDPDAEAKADLFDYWRATAAFTLQGMNLRYSFYLTKPVTSSYQTLCAQATAGGLSLTNMLRLGGDEDCRFGFARDDVTVSWKWCDLNMRATFAVSCAGFDQAAFSMRGLPISGFLPGITLNLGLTFTVDAKTLSTTLQWRPAAFGCIRLYSELEVGAHGVEIEGVSIYGVKLEYDIGGVKLVSATSLNPANNSRVTGQTDYFEVLRMSGTTASCCGVPGTWGIATYFCVDSKQLSDWGMLTGTFELALADDLDVRFETVFRSGDLGFPPVELSFGWIVRW
ncbi:Ig-like domain-containing protein [Candidatus Bipolaricaulota bacterium]